MALTDQEVQEIAFGSVETSPTGKQLAGLESPLEEGQRLAGLTQPASSPFGDQFPLLPRPTQTPVAIGQFFSSQTKPDRGSIAAIGDFIADQLTPLNIAILAASLYTGSAAARAFPILAKTGLSLLPAQAGREALPPLAAIATKAAVPLLESRGFFGTFFRNAVVGAAGIIPFALGDLVEEPAEGETRLGNFAQELLVLELFDLAFFAPVGAVFRAGSRGLRKATAENVKNAVARHVENGIAPDVAKARAFAEIIALKVDRHAAEFGPEAAASILESAEGLARAPKNVMAQLVQQNIDVLRTDPKVVTALARQGIPLGALDDTLSILRKGFEETNATAIIDESKRKVAQKVADLAAGESIFNNFIKGPKTAQEKLAGIAKQTAKKNKIPLSAVTPDLIMQRFKNFGTSENGRLFRLFVEEKLESGPRQLPVLSDFISGEPPDALQSLLLKIPAESRAEFGAQINRVRNSFSRTKQTLREAELVRLKNLSDERIRNLITLRGKKIDLQRARETQKRLLSQIRIERLKSTTPEAIRAGAKEISRGRRVLARGVPRDVSSAAESQRFKLARSVIQQRIATDAPTPLRPLEAQAIRSLSDDELNALITEILLNNRGNFQSPNTATIEAVITKIFTSGEIR